MKLISCHDCNSPVSSSASACPKCGSRQPAGPPNATHRKRPPIYNVEARNDRNMIAIAIGLGVFGVLYGIGTSSGPVGGFVLGILYGVVGILIGVPVAFLVNITRRLWH